MLACEAFYKAKVTILGAGQPGGIFYLLIEGGKDLHRRIAYCPDQKRRQAVTVGIRGVGLCTLFQMDMSLSTSFLQGIASVAMARLHDTGIHLAAKRIQPKHALVLCEGKE
jgi:hypothetical protein